MHRRMLLTERLLNKARRTARYKGYRRKRALIYPERKAYQMLHHYITKYTENGKKYAEAWLQLNVFGFSFCFSKRKKELEG